MWRCGYTGEFPHTGSGPQGTQPMDRDVTQVCLYNILGDRWYRIELGAEEWGIEQSTTLVEFMLYKYYESKISG
jgi:hypothetical protein